MSAAVTDIEFNLVFSEKQGENLDGVREDMVTTGNDDWIKGGSGGYWVKDEVDDFNVNLFPLGGCDSDIGE